MKRINDKTDGYNDEIDSQGLQSAKVFFTDSTYFALVIHKL